MTIESCCYCTDVDTDGSEHQRGIHISTSTLTGFLYAATKQVFLLIISHFLRLPFACILQKDTKHTVSDRCIIAVHSAYCIFQQIMLAQRSMMLLLSSFLFFCFCVLGQVRRWLKDNSVPLNIDFAKTNTKTHKKFEIVSVFALNLVFLWVKQVHLCLDSGSYSMTCNHYDL